MSVREVRELGPGESGLAFEAMRELRPDLAGEADLARRVDELQRPEGYRLVAVLDGGPAAAAVAGFRVCHSLSWGRFLYVDDLSTLPAARRRGHAGALLDWLLAEAALLGCDQVHLDSGVGGGRADAHRLYMSKGYVIAAHHFARRVPQE